MKKDILFLCQFFYPEYNSSATLPFDTARYLASQGLNVETMCGYPKEYSNVKNVPLEELIEGVLIKRIKYIELNRTRTTNRLINYFSFTLAILIRLFSFKNYKSVIVYSNPPVLPIIPILAKLLFGTKFVFVAYDVYPEVAYASQILRPGCLIDKVMRIINYELYKHVSMVISLTDEMKELLLQNRQELTRDRVTTIANWAHEKERKPDYEAYARFGYEDGQFVVAYFGNMGTCQDMDTLMGAAVTLKDNNKIKFLIIGHGNKKEKVRQFIQDNALTNVQEMDFLVGKDFEQAVAISSCCVVSLEKGLMGTCAPSKYYSYLQGGKAIIAVVEKESYLAKEVTTENIGIAVEIGDSDGLARRIIDLAADGDACKDMGVRAKMVYDKKYSYDIAMQKYYETLMKVME